MRILSLAGISVLFLSGCFELGLSELGNPRPDADGGIPSDCVPIEPPGESPEPPPPLVEPPGISVNFTDPDDRAMLVEDGLEYVVRKGAFAVYRVTSDTPRIYIPGSISAKPRTMHHTAFCMGHFYFTEEPPPVHSGLELRGVVDGVDKLLERRAFSPAEFGSCGGPVDIRGATDGDDQIEDLYLTFDPAPPIGSLVPLMMVAIGFEEEPPHMSDEIRISCNALGACTWHPGIIVGSAIVATCPEPPGPNEPPGGDDPPTPTEPPGGGEPPGGDEPPGVSDPPECPPGYGPIDPGQPQPPLNEPVS